MRTAPHRPLIEGTITETEKDNFLIFTSHHLFNISHQSLQPFSFERQNQNPR